MKGESFTMVPCPADGMLRWTKYRLEIYDLMIRRSQHCARPAYGGVISIAKLIGCSTRTARRSLRFLEEARLLIRTYTSRGGPGIAHIYRVIVAGFRSAKSLVVGLSAKLGQACPTKQTLQKEKSKKEIANEEKPNTHSPPLPNFGNSDKNPLEGLERIKKIWQQNFQN